MTKRIVLLYTLLAMCLPLLFAGSVAEDRETRLRWWRDARFGMFIHWGLYAVPAGEWKGQAVPGIGEWIMNHAKIPVAEYEKLAAQFNPVQFNADAWVSVAKNAGMKYIVITSKHHDGFAMFASRASKYNIVDATPFHRDPLKELAAACQRAGLKLGFYYSQTQDWHEPNGVGNTWDWPDETKKSFQRYWDQKVIPQVRELLTNYGPVALIWFDTPRNITKEQSAELAALVHKLQPQCLVSGRVGNGMGDYDSAGDNQISVGKVARDWETPVTLNDTWGYKKDDHNWKSPGVLIRQLAMVASRGGNYLLNVGPTAQGVIPDASVERLAAVGSWMKTNGESIYGTSASPFPYELPWGTITAKPGKLYLHIFNWPHGEFVLYGIKTRVRRAYLLVDSKRESLDVRQSSDPALQHYELHLKIPAVAPDANDSVIALDIDQPLDAVTMLQQQPDGNVTLPAYAADIHAPAGSARARTDSRGVMERWTRADEWIDWKFQVSKPGTFDVALITSEQKYGKDWEGGHSVVIDVAGQSIRGAVSDDGHLQNPSNPYWPYVMSKVGQIEVHKPGAYNLSLKPAAIQASKNLGLTLVSVTLIPHQQ